MEKIWSFIKKLTLPVLRLLLPVLRLLLPVLRLVGRVFLFFARLTRLNRVLNWADLWLIAKPYWVSESRNKALALLAATLLCMVANAKAAYYFGLQLKILNDIVNSHAGDNEFFMGIAWLAGIAVIWTVVGGLYGYFRSYLALDWRIWISRMYMGQYVKNEAYLRLQMSNPDQRLAQDPDTFANTTIWLAMILIETAVNLYTFVPVLWDASRFLMACCIGAALVSYVAVLFLGRELSGLTGRQYDSEASLRTGLQDGPNFGPSIALQRSEPLFLAKTTGLLSNVKTVLARVMRVNLYIGFYNGVSGKVVENAALVGIGWLVMHGTKTMGQIAQAGQAFTAVYGGLTVFTSQWGAYTTLKVELERLGPLARALEDIGENRMPQGHWIEYAEAHDDVVQFDHVTILSSYLDSKPVVNDMTLAFEVDTLVTGRDGHGKNDMAKAIGLLAASGSGKITRPARDKVMFLTQTPYIPVSTLREFLLDGRVSGPEDDARLINTLELVGLDDLVEHSRGETTGGLDTPQVWKKKISEPQQQQLCLARAILFKPLVLVVDQATDGLEPEIEEDIYKVLRGLGVRLITFSNSGRLAKSHKRVVELREDRGFDKYDSKDYSSPGWKSKLRRWGGSGG